MPAPNTFCTIVTADYLCYAQTIYESLQGNKSSAHFHVLVVGEAVHTDIDKNIFIDALIDIQKQFPGDYASIQKYEADAASNFRWALKPLYLKYLLTHLGYDKAIFIDPDTFFYENPQFLFDRLDASEVILTPHWRAKNPNQDTANFNLLFTGGLFNAGFFGCNRQAIDILDWWLSVCAYRMEKANGFYVDQAYLNLMPVYFADRVGIVNHKGCNVSNWNRVECKRKILVESGYQTLDTNRWVLYNSNLQKHYYPDKNGNVLLTKKNFSDIFFMNMPINKVGEPTATMFRTCIQKKIGLFHEEMKQALDIEYWYRILKISDVLILGDSLVSFRLHHGQATQANMRSKDNERHSLEKVLYKDYFWLISIQRRIKLFKKFHPISNLYRFFKNKFK